MIRPMLLSLGASLIATAAFAQTSAETMMRSTLAQKGIASGVSYQSYRRDAYDPEEEASTPAWPGAYGPPAWPGLAVSWTMASGGGVSALVAVIENHTDRPYCIRTKHVFDPMPEHQGVMLTVNRIVEPHDSIPILSFTFGSTYSFSYKPHFAYWPPNPNGPDNMKCRSVAPAGLDDWLARSVPIRDFDEFEGSVR